MKSEDNSTSNNSTNGVKASGIQQSIGVGVPAHPPQLSSTHNSLQSNPLATAYLHPNPAMAALQNPPTPGFGYHFPPEYMVDQRGLGLSRNSFEAFADFNTMRLQQHYLQQQQQQQQQQRLAEKLQASNNPSGLSTTSNSNSTTSVPITASTSNNSNSSSNSSSNSTSGIVRPSSPSNNGVNNSSNSEQQQQQTKGMGITDDRYQLLYEREARWSEVRKYSEFIRRFAMEASHVDVTKDNYYDLYNMAVCLLKSVDSLDPDKLQSQQQQVPQSSQLIAPPPPPLPLSSGRKNSEFDFSSHFSGSNTALNALLTHQPDYEFLQARKSFDYYFNRGSLESSNLMNREIPSMYYNNGNSVNVTGPYMNNNMMSQYPHHPPPPPPPLPPSMNNANAKAMLMDNLKHHSKNYTGEVFFDDLSNATNPNPTSNTTNTSSSSSNSSNSSSSSNNVPQQTPIQSSPTSNTSPNDSSQDDPRRPKRRRRRTVYSSRRNLHCHMCGVTETPEWRRGPAGDHTLCNACGLHYAKSLKKQKKEAEGRKHSIDSLLNVHTASNSNVSQQSAAPTTDS